LAKLLEGKPVAEAIKSDLAREIRALQKKTSRPIVLASIAVGDNVSAKVYTNAQRRVAEELGVTYQLHSLKQDIPEAELCAFIESLNKDNSVQGVIVQMPLPSHIDYKKISGSIAVEKDVEGVHPANIGRLLFSQPPIVPCTAAAVMELIKATGVDLYGKDAVIVGHSQIVGKPLSLLLLEKFATVTVCHIATSEAGKLEDYVKQAEILVAAVGKAALIKGSWIRKGAIVVDVGINRVKDKIAGDVEFETAQKKAAWITPVPGGVGPLTVVMLMKNLLEAAKLQI
jgi:methylenetetrahydrofolate dehydrogenase (NADP+)/methenyltetrahydrofolate cyclohydrolase